jgi:HTH-type transcriptional regulator/antitoxin MqsA
MSDNIPGCPICDSATELVRSPREIKIGQRRVVVDDERMRCRECGEEFYLPGQLDATARRAAEQVRREEGLLFPDEIKAIRQRLGMTQAEFEQLLATGPKTVVRWERGTVCQSTTADRLMRLVDVSALNVEYLRDLHGLPESVPSPALSPRFVDPNDLTDRPSRGVERINGGAVRKGRGMMCNICGLNCGKSGALRKHVEAAHGLPYERYKDSFYGQGDVVTNAWNRQVDTDNVDAATYTHILVRIFTRRRKARGTG